MSAALPDRAPAQQRSRYRRLPDQAQRGGVSTPVGGTGNIAAGEHVCALIAGDEQRLDAMGDFVAEGLRTASKCIAFVGDPTPDALVDRLGQDLDVDGLIGSGQLEVGGADHAFFQPDEFDVDNMLAFWQQRVQDGCQNSFETVRLTAEAAWWGPQLPGGDALIRYESELNRLANDGPQSILCVYDIATASGAFVLDILKVHPRVFFCGHEMPNPYYLRPEEYLALRTAPATRDSAEADGDRHPN
jgi:hypothetical protein